MRKMIFTLLMMSLCTSGIVLAKEAEPKKDNDCCKHECLDKCRCDGSKIGCCPCVKKCCCKKKKTDCCCKKAEPCKKKSKCDCGCWWKCRCKKERKSCCSKCTKCNDNDKETAAPEKVEEVEK